MHTPAAIIEDLISDLHVMARVIDKDHDKARAYRCLHSHAPEFVALVAKASVLRGTAETLADTYDAGRAAYHAGAHDTACPYSGEVQRAAWAEGHYDARTDAERAARQQALGSPL